MNTKNYKKISKMKKPGKKPKIIPQTEIGRRLQQFADDHVWIDQNREMLLEKYAEQWVAVEKGKVIASDPDFKALLAKLSNPAFTCTEFITRQPVEFMI
jgi:hypothetical protein